MKHPQPPSFAPSALSVALLCANLACGIPTATAHHSFAAEFDINQPVEFSGRVVRVALVNPHSWIYVEVRAKDGARQTWMIEGGSPNQLSRKGFTRNTLPAGTLIDVTGYRARDGELRAVGRTIKLPNGQFLAFQPNELPKPIRRGGLETPR